MICFNKKFVLISLFICLVIFFIFGFKVFNFSFEIDSIQDDYLTYLNEEIKKDKLSDFIILNKNVSNIDNINFKKINLSVYCFNVSLKRIYGPTLSLKIEGKYKDRIIMHSSGSPFFESIREIGFLPLTLNVFINIEGLSEKEILEMVEDIDIFVNYKKGKRGIYDTSELKEYTKKVFRF